MSPSNYRILLVEDEPSIAETIELNLELEGYSVTTVNNGKEGLKAFHQSRFNLLVLDVMLPEMDGFTLCEAIRLENSSIPILFLTAKSSGADRVNGLRKGGDDYLTKPFNLEELLLRVNKLIRRSLTGAEQQAASPDEYNLKGFIINFPQLKATSPEGEVLNLTKKETALLKFLIAHKNEVISREHILETVWGYDIYPSTRSIDNFMVNFRKYFEKDPANPKIFHAVRGVGYKFVD